MEDSLLWVNMMKNDAVCANIDDYLVYVRTGEDMFERRGGWDILKNIIQAEKDLFNRIYILELIISTRWQFNLWLQLYLMACIKIIYAKMLRRFTVL